MLGIPHPFVTTGLPGVGGTIKERPEDFVVEEVPLYTPCGKGEHTYFEVEKTDLSTPEALERLARAFRCDSRDFGYAGLKDRKAVTRQTFSIAGVDPSRVLALEIPQIKVLWAALHTNKLRVGHLKGNKFRIWVRGIQPGCEQNAREILAQLLRTGLPNFYGQQRFGNRGDAHRVGRAFLLRDDRYAVRRILGFPSKSEHNPHVVRGRELFMAGDYRGALAEFPSTYRQERQLLSYLLNAGENYSGAKRKLGDSARKLYHTAYQSFLFNLVLVERLRATYGDLGTLYQGDIAFLHRNGAVFYVEDPEREAPRAATFEISPSGPIFGMKMPFPLGTEGEIEGRVLATEAIRASDFHQLMPKLKLEGGRRPFRVRVEDLKAQFEGNDLFLEFSLPKGSYATVLLREVMKNEVVPEGFYEDGEEQKYGLWRPGEPSRMGAIAEMGPHLDPDD